MIHPPIHQPIYDATAPSPINLFLGSPMCPSGRLPHILFILENDSKSVNTICAQNPEFSVLKQVVYEYTLTTFLESIQCVWRASLDNAAVCMHYVPASWKAKSLYCCIALQLVKLRQIWRKICKRCGRSFRSQCCLTSRLPYVSRILD